MKCDDELFSIYNLTEKQLRYLLKDYQMYEDIEIRQTQETIANSFNLINNLNF